MSRLAAYRRSVADATAACEEYLPTLERFWRGQIRRLSRTAIANLQRHQPHGLAAAGPPWSMPNDDEILHLPSERVIVAAAVAKHWDAIMAILVEMGAESGISFATRNRLVREVLVARGQHITSILETTRREIMEQLTIAYEKGESIPKASRRVAQAMGGASRYRSTMIASTEMIGAVNGANVRLASVIDGTSLNDDGSVRRDTLGHDPINIWKVWVATADRRTRPTHAAANDQVVPMKDPFIVGGARLQYPGDPSGPGQEVIHCRCAVTYQEGPIVTSPSPVGGKLAGTPAPAPRPGLVMSEEYHPQRGTHDASSADVAAANDRATAALKKSHVAAPPDRSEPHYTWAGSGSDLARAKGGGAGGWYRDDVAPGKIEMNGELYGKRVSTLQAAGLDERAERVRHEFASYVTHEYGHHVDETFKRLSFEEMARTGAVTGMAEYMELHAAIDASSQIDLLTSGRVRGKPDPKRINEEYQRYLLLPEEKFARAFQQFIAVESDDEGLLGWVRRDPTLWNMRDFELIRAAMAKFLRSIGWQTS